MYYLSELTGNYYLENNGNYTEIPKDDLDASYVLMMSIGNIQIAESFDFEIEEMNKPKVPKQLSRMKFIMQVFITTGIKYEDIVIFIQNLEFNEATKYLILTRLRGCTHFERSSSDLLTISQMMGITQEQLDSIFINGNLIE